MPRLIAGGDLDRVHFLEAKRDERPDLIGLPGDIPEIADTAVWLSAKLIVIDPLTAALGARLDTHRDAAVRSVLAPLAQMACERRAGRRILAHVETNNGPLATSSLEYKLRGVKTKAHGSPISTSLCELVGTSDVSADALVAAPDAKRRVATSEAEEFLLAESRTGAAGNGARGGGEVPQDLPGRPEARQEEDQGGKP